MVDPLAIDQWVLWLPTAVTLGPLSMKEEQGLVSWVGPGVGQLQLVKVRNDFRLETNISSGHTHTAVSCGSPPSVLNGTPGIPTSTTFRGTVTYSCDSGYTHSGSATITCQASGSWETPPVCTLIGELVAGCSCDHGQWC